MKREIAILGAGNLGLAQAGCLAQAGHGVRLYNRSPERLEQLLGGQPLSLRGAVQGDVMIPLVTAHLTDAIRGAELIFIDVPASGHAELAMALRERLPADSSALVLLHPGQTFGARHFARCLGVERFPSLALGELQTALYTARASSPATVNVLAVKREVRVAAYPASANPKLAPAVELSPQLRLDPTTLHTALSNVQLFIHPAVVLLNRERISRGEPFRLYREGLTDAVDACLNACDAERLAVARSLGIDVPTAAQWFGRCYGVQAETAVGAMRQVEAYEHLLAPTSLATRLLTEDVPTGLVPMLGLARKLGVPAPNLARLLGLAEAVTGTAAAWTLASLGLEQLDRAGLVQAFA